MLLAGTTAALLIHGHYPVRPLWAILAVGIIAAFAEGRAIAVTERVAMSVSFLPLVFAAVAFGPLAAFLAGAISNASDLRRPILRWVVYTPIRAMTGAITGVVAWQVLPDSHGFAGYLLVSLAAAVTYLASDGLLAGATLMLRGGEARTLVQTLAPLFVLAVPLYVPLLGLFVYGYFAYSVWVVVAFFVPALAVQNLIHLYQEQREAARRLAAANGRLASANLSFATALVATLDARDRYTAGHSAAVAVYARDIAERMGLSPQDQGLAHLCGLVHDVGKIGLSASVLEKPGALSLEERRLMEQHSVIGERILRKVDDYGEIAAIVRHHHERVDGLGYPDRLVGDQIPLLSRIIGVADAYNAMTSDRPYRDAMPSRVARLRLAQAVDSQFDTAVVAAFEAILAAASEEYRMGIGAEFGIDYPAHQS
ncbi:MAG TPA: HD-GYP domain-containing protein, partial [Solirubrobacteraceae bacterium]|nr:HD-GYP domain-containing protein [Solirubrobacteraceae bacterium]